MVPDCVSEPVSGLSIAIAADWLPLIVIVPLLTMLPV